MHYLVRFCCAIFAALMLSVAFSSNHSAVAQNAGDVLISEFRYSGPANSTEAEASNCFVELYNNTDSPITVTTADGSGGWALVSSTSQVLVVIPNGTVIPARSHYLAGGSTYSLSAYAPKDIDMANIVVNRGIALFKSSTSFTLANRLDAVGPESVSDPLYKEGTGLPNVSSSRLDYSFVRRIKVTPGTGAGLPIDENNNATDFIYVDPLGSSIGAGIRLGAPGPESLTSPIQRNAQIRATLLDPASGSPSSAENRRRYRCTDPDRPANCDADPNSNTSPLGFLSIRRTYTNNTGQLVTRLRFRVVDITTYPEGNGTTTAELLALSRSGSFTVTTLTQQTYTVQGLTLEQPPTHPYGGGFNSSLVAPTVTLQTPLAVADDPGTPAKENAINVEFLLGIVQTGNFRFFVNVEALTQAPPPAFSKSSASVAERPARGKR